jgi:hypothetical protein
MWRKEHLWDISVLQRIHLSILVYVTLVKPQS